MRCDRCGREAVHFQRYAGLRLCREHLAASLEGRAKGLIRARGWIRPRDRIAVGLSGSPGSSSLLCFLRGHFGMRRDLSLVAITVDEGGSPGWDMARIRGIAEGMGVEWTGTCFPELGGDPAEGIREDPVTRHRSLRLHALASLAGEMGATRLALGTSLDDEAGSVFLSVIRGEAARLVGRPEEILDGITLIRPFMGIPGDELTLYARLTVPDYLPPRERQSPDLLEGEAARMLADYTTRHPSAMFAVANMGEGLAIAAGPVRRGRSPGGRCREPGSPAGTGRRGNGRVTDHG